MRHFLSARIHSFKNWPEEEKHIRIDPPGEDDSTVGMERRGGGNIADGMNENTE